jgi:hypothetical protein
MASTYELLLLAQTAQLGVPVSATPVSTTLNGTPTSGSSEVFDAVLGYYQATLIAGRRYLAVVNGLVGNGAAGEVYAVNIRNSGTSSNPTTSSTAVASSEWYCPVAGTGGRGTIALAGSFIAPATGVNTFGLSSVRVIGSGTFTPISSSTTGSVRELYVMYLGAV